MICASAQGAVSTSEKFSCRAFLRISGLWPGRLVAARLVIPGGEVVNLYCQYLVTSSGWSRCNIEIVNKVGRHMIGTKLGEHHLVGGDWNMLPEAVAASKLLERLGCVIAAPPAETATHISKTVANILDFFLVSRALAQGLKKVGVVTSAKTRPHRPTVADFHAGMADLMVQQFAPVAKHNLEGLPFGPVPPPKDWAPTLAIAEAALASFQ